ncbi:MAG: hypothetical protein ACYC6Y_32270 [Thermoguttaceae bacterium]
MSQQATETNARNSYREIAKSEEMNASEAAFALFKQYAQDRPEVVALWTFGIGFILGWKLKPW